MYEDDMTRRLQALADEGKALETEVRARNREVLRLIGIPETGPVTATFDERGVLSGFAFQPRWRELKGGTELLAELNNAIVRATFDGDIPIGGPAFAGLDLAALQNDPPQPAEARNGGGTLTVTAFLGSVTKLDADPGWLEGVSDQTLSAEVGAAAAEAAESSDIMGRLRPTDTTEGGTA